MNANRILRREEVGRLREADRILREAEQTRQSSREDAVQLEKDIVSEARLRALRESTRTASRLIAKAEEAAQTRLRNMEPELARLVADTVRSILGDFESEELTYRTALQALRQLRDHRRGRVFASTDTVGPVRRAVDEIGADGPEILSVIPDPALEPSRAFLTSDRGSAEIGSAALIDRALQPWEEQAGGNPSSPDGEGDKP